MLPPNCHLCAWLDERGLVLALRDADGTFDRPCTLERVRGTAMWLACLAWVHVAMRRHALIAYAGKGAC